MRIKQASIGFNRLTTVTQTDERVLEVRQRSSESDPWSTPIIIEPAELSDLLRIAKMLGWVV